MSASIIPVDHGLVCSECSWGLHNLDMPYTDEAKHLAKLHLEAHNVGVEHAEEFRIAHSQDGPAFESSELPSVAQLLRNGWERVTLDDGHGTVETYWKAKA